MAVGRIGTIANVIGPTGPAGAAGAASTVTGPTGPTGPSGAADYTLTQQAQTDSYTLVLGDANKLVELNKATAVDLNIPTNSNVAFPTGTQIHILQVGAGQVTIKGQTGVQVDSNGGALRISGQWRTATVIKRATNTWVAIGSLTT